jgi:hypothetical protein
MAGYITKYTEKRGIACSGQVVRLCERPVLPSLRVHYTWERWVQPKLDDRVRSDTCTVKW